MILNFRFIFPMCTYWIFCIENPDLNMVGLKIDLVQGFFLRLNLPTLLYYLTFFKKLQESRILQVCEQQQKKILINQLYHISIGNYYIYRSWPKLKSIAYRYFLGNTILWLFLWYQREIFKNMLDLKLLFHGRIKITPF